MQVVVQSHCACPYLILVDGYVAHSIKQMHSCMLTVTATCDHEQHPIMNSLSHLLIVLTAQ